MLEPHWIHLLPIEEVAARPHQSSRGCWCGPQYAIDIRSTLGRDDVRVLLHRGSTAPTADEKLLALRARKGVVVEL
jgi:hypothetical protein